MSDYKRKPGEGIIFKNSYKEEGSNQPDYKGTVLGLDGHELEIALWVKEGQKGKFFSCRIQEKYKKMESKQPDEIEDDLPF